MLELQNVSYVVKDENNVDKAILKYISVKINDRFVAVTGPNGGGKSTLAKIIAGIYAPTSGKIFFGDDDVTELTTENRGIGLVFQNYALYPHMDVYNNMSFGLKLRKFKKDEIKKRVEYFDKLRAEKQKAKGKGNCKEKL